MKKVKVSGLPISNNLLGINADFIGVDEQGKFFKTNNHIVLTSQLAGLTAGEQYALICDTSRANYLSQSGIITFSKVSFDLCTVGLYSIGKTSNGYAFNSPTSNIQGYRVTRNGVEYIAIKKPNISMAASCSLVVLYAYDRKATMLEIVNATDLTNIVAL